MVGNRGKKANWIHTSFTIFFFLIIIGRMQARDTGAYFRIGKQSFAEVGKLVIGELSALPEQLYLPVVQKNWDPYPTVLIPAGSFQMGCDPAHNGGYPCENNELPLHTVNLSLYYIDKFEVTNAQFAAFLNVRSSNLCSGFECIDMDDPNGHILYSGGGFIVESGYEHHPVFEVTWYGADAYCQETGGRLPTEAEWEKAARGSTDTRAYPWGDASPTCALVNGDYCVGDPTPVGIYPGGASPYGVQDMAGNVWEWVNDWYSSTYYQSSPFTDPQGPASGTSKVLRGGSWASLDRYLRVAIRLSSNPTGSSSSMGFRCAHSP